MTKTTVDVSDGVLAAAQARAASEHTTLREVVESALRVYASGSGRGAPFRLRDASVHGEGLTDEFAGRSFSDLRDAAYGNSV